MIDYFIDLATRLGHWGYLVVFVVAALESAAFVGVVVPGEAVVLASGFLAARGIFDLDALIIVVAIGATIGDSVGYELGRRWGRQEILKWGKWVGLTRARIERADKFFERHGGKAVLLGRFVGFARALVPFIAGSSRMPYRTFLPFNATGAALWAVAIVLLGYFLGASWGVAEQWIGRASALIGGLVLFVLALVWAGRWASTHEAQIKSAWEKILAIPPMAALERRVAPLVGFIKARLSPESFVGLRLTLGALFFIGAAWTFGGIAQDVVAGDPLTHIDTLVAQWLHGHATPSVTQVMIWVSDLHSGWVIGPVTLAVALGLLWRNDRYALLALVLAVPGGMILNVLTKQAFQRSRPFFEDPLLVLHTYAFPSGHVAAATLIYGVLTVLLAGRIGRWSFRVAIVLAAVLMVMLVALSRMYLGVHYLSDVLAAFFEAVAWLALCFTGVHWLEHARGSGRARSKHS